MLVAIFDTQQFCSSDGGSIPSDCFSKELKTTQITQATLTLFQLWTLIFIYIDAKKCKHCRQQKFAYKEVKSADSNVWCHFWS